MNRPGKSVLLGNILSTSIYLSFFLQFVYHICVVNSTPPLCNTQPPQEEVNSLIDLYTSTNGQSWNNKWNINSPQPNPCEGWYGVKCYSFEENGNMNCRVGSLQLPNNNLKGTLSMSIGNLSKLETLYLYSNKLTGYIPSSIGNLSQLQSLYLYANQLKGCIPSSIGSLNQLQELYLYSNLITGTIPASIGNLTQLKELYLYSNKLRGRIPVEIGNLYRLQALNLYSNLLTGTIPSTIGNLAQLQTLNLYSNILTGRIPSSVGNIFQLQTIGLYLNRLTGNIPSSIGKLYRLQTLNAYSNKFTGSIPSSIGNLTQMKLLSLYSNELTGSIPSSIGDLIQLQRLELFSNKLTGSIPSSIGNLTQLTTLDFNSNFLTGMIPSSIGNLTQVQTFTLYSNLLASSLPFSIGNLLKVEQLYLYSNQLTGSIPSTIGNLSKLVTLNLFENQLMGTLPSSIGNLTKLGALNVYLNQLTGSIPSSVGGLVKLGVLNLYSNKLTGTIPSSIKTLVELGSLNLYSNHLHGTIPSSIGNLVQLGSLNLYENELMGTFPSTITNLINLKTLVVTGNAFNGSLPSFLAFTKLVSLGLGSNKFVISSHHTLFPTSLKYLDLSNNSLTEFSYVVNLFQQNLQYLDLTNNAFSGSLPPEIWNTTVGQLYLNSNKFYGSFPLLGDRICSIQYLTVSNNFLTGTLPQELSLCKNLTSFYASDMDLTGSIIGRFSTQQKLQTVVLANNSLSGPIDDVFASSQASNLILNLAYNAFSGSLPINSLLTGQYQSLTLLSNCLSGTLPAEALCANTNMTELLLSGLHASSACRSIPLSFVTNSVSYMESAVIGGTIPPCLLSPLLPLLNYLSLSGNLLQGSLSRDVTIVPMMTGLDLSHNMLTGSIPAAILEANLSLLDLSFNHLAGTIASSATNYYALSSNYKVALEVNQLSGTLPQGWINAQNIQVLNGNVFSCEAGTVSVTANLPVHDALAATYACGSSVTNIALFTAMVTLISLGLVYMILRNRHDLWKCPGLLFHELIQLFQTCYLLLGSVLHIIVVACAFLALSLLLYAVLTVVTSAYEYTYVWVVSLSLQQGTLAGCLLFVWLFVLSVWIYDQFYESSKTKQENATWMKTMTVSMSHLEIWFVLLLTHNLPVFAVNIAYVYTTTLKLTSSKRALIVVTMSLFKLTWNSLMGKMLSGYKRLRDASFWFSALSYFAVVNIILTPAITEMLVSSNCFWYLFSAIPTDSYIVEGGTCYWIMYGNSKGTENSVVCMSYDELQAIYNSGSSISGTGNYNMLVLSTTSNGEAAEVDFAAGFIYNYQCTFSLLEAFVYVFIYKYLGRIVLLPLLWVGMKRLQTWCYDQFGLSSKCFQLISRYLPPSMRLLLDVDVDVEKEGRLDEIVTYNASIVQKWRDSEQSMISSKMLKMRLVLDFAVSLSYGLLFPLLGIMSLVAVLVDVLTTHWMIQSMSTYGSCMIQNWERVADMSLQSADAYSDKRGSKRIIHGLEEHVLQVLTTVKEFRLAFAEEIHAIPSMLPSLLCFAAVPWCLALYDIVGRQEGAINALWILIATLTMPWWTAPIVLLYRYAITHVQTIQKDVITISTIKKSSWDGEIDLEMVENPLRQKTSKTIPKI